ncbi:hypothetical protein Taro_034285, partial [Colocasia esculenta]|nr:hypothetical protein [Colocasia esculenta]
TQASVGPKTSLISKLRSLAAIHCKWIQDIGCARQEMIGEHRFTQICLSGVDTVHLSTLVPASRKPVLIFGTVCRHTQGVCRHSPTETQECKFFWTRGCLGIERFDLDFCAHAPQGTSWTYGAINTPNPCTPKENTMKESPYNTQKSYLVEKWVSPYLTPSPEAAGHPFKRNDVGIKRNLWSEGYCARKGSRSN